MLIVAVQLTNGKICQQVISASQRVIPWLYIKKEGIIVVNLPESDRSLGNSSELRTNSKIQYRYYDIIMLSFSTVAICSNFISSSKIARIGPLTFGAGVIFFPLSYVISDVLTEVYGYARSRRVIWAGFGAMAFATLTSMIVLGLPPDPAWPNQDAWATVFGSSGRIVLASMFAFLFGTWVNSAVLAKMKVITEGNYLWTRTIGSTIAGEAVDSLIFYPAAFLLIWPTDLVFRVMVADYSIKVLIEIAVTPLTYIAVAYLKRSEHEDYYDLGTNFTLFPHSPRVSIQTKMDSDKSSNTNSKF